MRNKIFSIIKILGLSIGLMVCMLIFLYTKDEISYDQFHENKAQLYPDYSNMADGKRPRKQSVLPMLLWANLLQKKYRKYSNMCGLMELL